ncbi:hypothetical protein GIB67_032516 [Kingdonia uniflora]|uniref:Uncharacterized protein n=1 Tax=Kingdonia uniflora TaxID=39325 RepID=A0A7J7L7Q7_9MAGN|nr:hypothetical protein GIB67_032516 [Kingdonia uniflora]
MGRLPVDDVSTFGRTNVSDSGGKGGLEQFQGFPGQLVSYPLGFDTFREFCKAKGSIGGKWGKCAKNMWEVITVCNPLKDRWEREKKVRRITPLDVLQFYGVKNFKASDGSNFCASVTRHRFFDLNLAGRNWNDNIIWVKGNCLQRNEEEFLDIRFISVKPSTKSTVERKKPLLEEVAEEETELELVMGELGLSRKKRVKSRWKKVVKAKSTRSMTGVDEGKRKTSGVEVRAKVLERIEKICRSDLNRCRIDLEKMRQKFSGTVDELRVAHKNLSASEAAAERVARHKPERDLAIAHAKKAEARERSGGSRTVIKAPLVQGDIVSLSGYTRELESDVSRIQGHVQKGNTNLREFQHKLDVALISEKVLEGKSELRIS